MSVPASARGGLEYDGNCQNYEDCEPVDGSSIMASLARRYVLWISDERSNVSCNRVSVLR